MVDSRLEYIKTHIPDSQLAREAIFEIERLRALLLKIADESPNLILSEWIKSELER